MMTGQPGRLVVDAEQAAGGDQDVELQVEVVSRRTAGDSLDEQVTDQFPDRTFAAIRATTACLVIQRFPDRHGLLHREGRHQRPRPVAVDDGPDVLCGPRPAGPGERGFGVGGGHCAVGRLLDLPG